MPTMFLDDAPMPGHALLAHLRRHRFVLLSFVLHAAPLLVLAHLSIHRIDIARRERQQQLIDAGRRLTDEARLEKRVQDMARIKSLLEDSAAPGSPHKEDDLQFGGHPRAPDELLKEARELSREIDRIARGDKAEELAKLLGIPKKKALEKLAGTPKPAPSPGATPRQAASAAAQIAQLEAKARAVLEQRRRQLERQQNGAPVAASASRTGANGPVQSGQRGTGKGSGRGGPGGQSGPGVPGARGAQGARAGAGMGRGSTGGASLSSVLDRIAEFTNPDMPDRATTAYAAGDLDDFFDHGAGHIPDLDPGTMVRGTGRIIGPGGPYANRVYVNRWYLIGPFEGRHGMGLFSNVRYPPEQAVALDAVYRGKGGRLLRWEYVDMASYPLIPPVPDEDAVYYGYTELMLDKERDLTIWVGADDDAQLWLNDRRIWRGGNVDKGWFFSQIYDTRNSYVRDYNLSEGKRVVHFRKGRNKLFFKLSNGPTRIFFSLVLTAAR